MLIEVTVKNLSGIGPRGTRKNVPANQARVLILLHKAKEVVPERAVVTQTYKRRDMVSEAPAAPVTTVRKVTKKPVAVDPSETVSVKTEKKKKSHE